VRDARVWITGGERGTVKTVDWGGYSVYGIRGVYLLRKKEEGNKTSYFLPFIF
jgi:hypothetical protein